MKELKFIHFFDQIVIRVFLNLTWSFSLSFCGPNWTTPMKASLVASSNAVKMYFRWNSNLFRMSGGKILTR